jgi:pimeloyl-ACP methyl ester carboxylesterase
MPRFPASDGTILAYHEKGSGPPLICLPGGPGRASAYLGDLGGLSAHRRLILLDSRGTGHSAVPADPDSYRCDRLVDDVEALRAHLGLERLDLLAHSAGNNLAVLYAARLPDRVSAMVLVTPGWRVTDLEFTDQEWITALRRREHEPWFADAFAAVLRWDGGEETWANRLAAARLFAGTWTEAHQAAVEQEESQIGPEARAGFGVDGAFGDPAETRAALRRLTAPVLLLGGAVDPAPTPPLLGEYAKLFPNATLIIQPDAGHSPWLDDPDRFTGSVAAFLARR